jgi:hypothetical protein
MPLTIKPSGLRFVLERIGSADAYGLTARARAAGISARPADGHGVRAARDRSRPGADSLLMSPAHAILVPRSEPGHEADTTSHRRGHPH